MNKISTRNLKPLPDIEQLRRLTQSIALLDAIISPEWLYRYYSFNSKWNDGEMMASMRNGSGDDYFILFNSAGAIIKGFAHEYPMTPYANNRIVWPGILDSVPAEFQDFLTEPAFTIEDATFCIWKRYADREWQCGDIKFPSDDDPDGSQFLLEIFDGNPKTYQSFAEDYYEKEFPLAAIEHIYQHKTLTQEIINNLNDEIVLSDLSDDLIEIGYGNDHDLS